MIRKVHNIFRLLGLSLGLLFTLTVPVWAAGGAEAGSPVSTIALIVVFIALMYFLMIRPQTKQNKQHQAMIQQLGVGSEIMTKGGIYGRISKVGENYYMLTVSEGVDIKIQQQSVSKEMPRNTSKKVEHVD